MTMAEMLEIVMIAVVMAVVVMIAVVMAVVARVLFDEMMNR